MTKEIKNYLIGRDSKTGKMITVKEARRRPKTTTVERVPKAGYGDSIPRKLRGIVLKK